MGDAFVGLIAVAIALAMMLIILYGGALVLTENFWLGVILLILLPPFFFIWAFLRGLSGK
jgi:hypothetical protein